jgi:hypothetical protein
MTSKASTWVYWYRWPTRNHGLAII